MRAALWVISTILSVAVLRAENAETLLTQGIERFQKGEYAAARETLKKAVDLSPADARAITYLAIVQATLGDCAHTINELAMQSKRNPDPKIRKLAGLASVQCLITRNDFAQIFPILTELSNSDPNDPDVLYLAAKVYNKAWNVTLYEMFQRVPSSYRVNQLSAEVFENQSKPAEAIAEYRKAIAKNPRALGLHSRLGRDLMLQSHAPETLEEARKEFEAELAINPNDAAAEFQLGQVLATQQKPADAEVHLEKALSSAPNFPEALVALARIRYDTKKFEEAIKLLERAVELAPAMQAAHIALMDAYRDAGRSKDAMREKEQLDKLQKPQEGEFSEFRKKIEDRTVKP
jgi:tetratricopeptide (TPR) repeat protein